MDLKRSHYLGRTGAGVTALGLVLGGIGLTTGATGASAMTITKNINVHCTIPVAGSEAYTAVISADAPDSVHVGDTVNLTNFQMSILLNSDTTNALTTLSAVSLQGTVTAGATVSNATPGSLSVTATVPSTPVPQTTDADGNGPAFTITTTPIDSPSATVTAAGNVTVTASTVSTYFNPLRDDGSSALPAAKRNIPCSFDSGQDLTLGTVPATAAASSSAPTTSAPTSAPDTTTSAPTSAPDTTTGAPTSAPETTTSAPTTTAAPTTSAPTTTPAPTTSAPTTTPAPTTSAPTTSAPTPTASPVATATPAPTATPVTSATPEPTVTPIVAATDANGDAVLPGSTLAAGQALTVSLTGAPPNTTLDVTLHSTPQDLGTTVSNSAGAISYLFTVPSGLEAGAHRLVFTSATSSSEFDFVVAGDPATTTTTTDLASTGYDSRPALYGGVTLLVLGVFMISVARRRTKISADDAGTNRFGFLG